MRCDGGSVVLNIAEDALVRAKRLTSEFPRSHILQKPRVLSNFETCQVSCPEVRPRHKQVGVEDDQWTLQPGAGRGDALLLI